MGDGVLVVTGGARTYAAKALTDLKEAACDKAAAYFCSDDASVIAGVMMPVDAGGRAATLCRSCAGGAPWEAK